MLTARTLRQRRLAPWGAALSATGTCILAVLGAAVRDWPWTWACVAVVAGNLGMLASMAAKRQGG
jgi:hypothetical protein